MNITEELRSNRDRLIRENRCQRLLTTYKAQLTDLDFISAYYYAYNDPADSWTLSLVLTFENEAAAREAALLLARRFDCNKPVSKTVTTFGANAVTNYHFSLPGLEISTRGTGAPRTCELVYDEVEVPARTERIARVVCPES